MKPLLAGKIENLDNLRFPLVASPKIDGIRCLIIDGKPVSRKLKPIPNGFIQSDLGALAPRLNGSKICWKSQARKSRPLDNSR